MSAAAPSDHANRAAVLYAQGDLRIEDVSSPTPGPREVLVEIRSVGVCGSDVHYYEHGRIGGFVVEAPLILGHESMGGIIELAPGLFAAASAIASRSSRVSRAGVAPSAATAATPSANVFVADPHAGHEFLRRVRGCGTRRRTHDQNHRGAPNAAC